jgi:protein SCO1/2
MNQQSIIYPALASLLVAFMTARAPFAHAGPALAACCQSAAMDPPGVPDAGDSIADLSAEWETDAGKRIKLSDLNGRVRVISMFYATCQGVCVTTKQDMQQIEASLSPAARQRVGFILVTLDPLRDTDAGLQTYRRTENLSPRRWTLLRGDDAVTVKLAGLLGVSAGRDGSGRFIHSSELIVLDASGRILHRHNGLHADLSAITKEIEIAALSQTKKP